MQRNFFDSPFIGNCACAEIHLTVLNNQRDKLKKLLEAKANPDQEDKEYGASTPLLMAIIKSDIKTIQLLLEYKADPNKPDHFGTIPLRKIKDFTPPFYDCSTPERAQELIAKHRQLNQEIIELLIKHGAVDSSIQSKISAK